MMIKPKNNKTYLRNVSVNTAMLKYSEKDLCKQFYHRVRILQTHNQFPFNFFIFHIANEQYTSKSYTFHLVKMGLRAGVADYCLLLPEGKVAFIEFKSSAKCKLSPKQEVFKYECRKLGIPHLVTYDIDIAVEWIKGLGGI